MKTYYDYVKSGLAKADRTREMLNRNHIHMEELPEQDQGIEIPNEPIENVNIVEVKK